MIFKFCLVTEGSFNLLIHSVVSFSEPLAGPDVSITKTGKKLILIQWDELKQDKQRGFITNYTIYFQRHRDKGLLQNRE